MDEYTIYNRNDEELTELATSQFIGALRKPILSAIREQVKLNGQVLVTVSNNQTFADFIIKKS